MAEESSLLNLLATGSHNFNRRDYLVASSKLGEGV